MWAAGSVTGRLLAILLGLLSILSVCSAAPKIQVKPLDDLDRSGVHIKSISVRGPHDLVARKPNAVITTFRNKLDNARVLVYTNDAQYVTFRDSATSIGSSGFEGCIGLIIATKKGALVGHFTQTNEGYTLADTQFRDLYKAHKKSLAGATPILYGQVEVDESTWKFPDVVGQFASFVQDLTGSTARMTSYLEPMETWVDQDGLPLDDVDYENFQSGGFVLENSGGGRADTAVTMISCRAQKHGAEPN